MERNGKQSQDPKAAASPAAGKQAYVLIHGMGEQIPMDTIKGFAETVWALDKDVQEAETPNTQQMWSRPDDRTGSLELRRITTRKSKACKAFPAGVRTDFYELYWADLTAGSTWEQFSAWVRYLLFRPWSKVPQDVRAAWLLLWFGAGVVVGLGFIALIPDAMWRAHTPAWLSQKLAIAAAAAITALLHRFASSTFGRVVRYTRSEPANIAARKAVRERGLALLRALHDGETPAYDRVVIVGHSLGTILALDLVSYFWAERAAKLTFDAGTPFAVLVAAMEQAAADLERDGSDANRSRLREAQGQIGKHLRILAKDQPAAARWLISDLVTIGSPLTHAEFLLADGPEDLQARLRARQLPTNPPFREPLDPEIIAAATRTGLLPEGEKRLIAYRWKARPEHWSLHFAAPFAAVRWTNVFDPARRVAQGDMISGPLAENFGRGILDLDISQGDKPSRRFSHTRYWDADQPEARLRTIRMAINLLDR